MSLRFILGRAGTGKTHTCLEEIRSALRNSPDGPSLIFLVPEQATFQSELALLSGVSSGNTEDNDNLPGMIRAQVLSFRRLAWRVLQETGGAARVHITEAGKQMILRKLLENRKEELKVFHRVADQPGFVLCLTEMISEMKHYRITPKALAQNEQKLLADKLHDLILIYNDLENYLAGRYTDPDDYLNLLAEKLDKSTTVYGAEVWVDGFAGFTPQEYRVIEKLLQVSCRVNVALCLDSSLINQPLEEGDLFHPTRETLNRLKAIANTAGINLEPPLMLDANLPPYRFQQNKAIAYLEQNFFNLSAAPFPDVPEGVKLVAASNRRAEVEGVAREIIRLCREQGYRWRDISVVSRDVEAYQALISNVFEDYGIPFFIDCKRPVMHHPLVELIRSALEVVAEGWTYDPIFRYLKTDLLPVTREEVDLLENYVLAHGIRGLCWIDGKRWEYRRRYTQGTQETEELDAVNQIRETATQALSSFYQKTKKPSKVREITSALFELLIELDVPARLEKWSQQAEDEGRLETAREHIQIWKYVMELFDQLVESLGEEEMGPVHYARILDAGLEGLRLGLIPPGLDQVLVGSLERSRNPSVKACFVLGVNDGILPARHTEKGIFSDTEREFLESAGINLAPSGRRRLFNEQFLVYIALTRSSEYLWVSYLLADEEGRALAPSQVVDRLKKLLSLKENMCLLEPPGTDEDLEYIVNNKRTLSYLTTKLREFKNGSNIPSLWWEVYSWYAEQPQWRPVCRRLLESLFYKNQETPIPSQLSRALYGTPLKTSISRIERYNECPFQHFLAYGLRLKERPMFKIQASDLGEFFHASLKKFGNRLAEMGQDWDLDKEDSARLVNEVVEELAPQLNNEILLSSSRYRYLTTRLKKTIERAVLVLGEHARRSTFRPLGLELSFGKQGELPPLVLQLSDQSKMELSGRIDRIDMAVSPKGNYIKVIDYKSGADNLKLNEIFCGLKLQLLAYLDVVLTHCRHIFCSEILPAGIFYFTVADPLIAGQGPLEKEQIEKEILKKLKMKGMVLADPEVVKMLDSQISGYSDLIPVGVKKDGSFHNNSSILSLEQFNLLRRYFKRLVKDKGEEIISGAVDIRPYRYKNLSPCRYCPFKPVCLFDPLLPENVYQNIADPPAEELWENIKKAGETTDDR